MQNTIAKSSQSTRDGLESVEIEADSTNEEVLAEAIIRLINRFIYGFRRIPKRGRMVIEWNEKGKGDKTHYVVTAKNETIDHNGVEVRRK